MPKSEQPLIKKDKKQSIDAPFQVSACPPLSVWLNPLIWLLWILDFLIWCISLILPVFTCLFCCSRCRQDSYENPNEDDGARRRFRERWDEEEGFLEHVEGDDGPCNTIWEIAQAAFEEFADEDALGTRRYLGQDSSVAPPRRIFGETEWETYEELGERVHAFGAGLRLLGLQPAGVDANMDAASHSMLIFEDTCAEWITGLLGAASQSVVVATSYATLGPKAVADAICECNVSVVLCNRRNVQEILKAEAPCLRHIIFTEHYVSVEDAQKTPIVQTNIAVQTHAFEDFIRQGQSVVAKFPPFPPHPDCLAVIMYTSGSTGKPKGVMITHGNVAASVAGLTEVIKPRRGKEVYIAHLPAAHIFEFCSEMVMLSVGAQIGYADPRTLTSAGAVRMLEDGTLKTVAEQPNPPGAIQEFRPSVMVAVPIIWDTFKKKMEEEVGKKGCLLRSLFQAAYSAQYWALKTGRTCPLFNLLVFRKFHNIVGGRLRFTASGGGPINGDVQSFISTVFGCNLKQGYALTETTCAGTSQAPNDPDTGNVGGPLSSVEIKVRSCDGPEDPADRDGYQYLSSDTDHYGVPCQGRGEICIRGPSLSRGYFKQPEKTAEVYDSEGWFHSGDIGYWDQRGRLVIVDRLKNLVKLKGGEYVALENMEKEYGMSPYVDGLKGGIMCYGDGDMRRPGAIVQVNVAELKKWARSQGLPDEDIGALCENDKAKKAVLASLLSAAKNIGANEKLVSVALVSGTGPGVGEAAPNSPWTPENGCRTASNKLDRKNIQKTCAILMEQIKLAGA
eukprot:TRINITY_DN8104_c0_g1_i1.p1 TRINITY_DN8104_c0_g1~~TRINITY_DN8104_c0_g1_i1.p1  ORF type:complete len:788 (-),score=119.27 TRINITY_DN8104_c0_g1_i1:103-2466(-)